MAYAALAAVGPVVWAAVDLAVTGDPMYSLTATGDLAEELGRNKGGAAVPESLYAFLIKLAKFPVVLGGAAGLLLAVVLTPRRALMPLVLFCVGHKSCLYPAFAAAEHTAVNILRESQIAVSWRLRASSSERRWSSSEACAGAAACTSPS